jgi:hypothetical protein
MELSPAQRRYLIKDHVVGSALFNAVLNAVLGMGAFFGKDRAPLWGNPGVALDLCSTAFFLPFFTSVIATPLIAWAVRRGKAEALAPDALDGSWLARLPSGPTARGALLGAVALLSTPPLVALLALSTEGSLSVTVFASIKALYAALLAALVTPVVALFAMRRPAARPAVS